MKASPAATAGWRTRTKPLLGTLVEISIPHRGEANFLHATDHAFARVQTIHNAMSFHESTSDLRALARARVGQEVSVSTDTFLTLQLAQQMERESDGVFNPTIAPELVARGLLPCPDDLDAAVEPTTLADSIVLHASNVVRILQPVWIDLGGIAKGYAVDAAVTALQQAGVTDGLVNAGGDLRVFGSVRHTLALRIPAAPSASIEVAELQDLSCATSGGYFKADANVNVNVNTSAKADAKALMLSSHPAIIGKRSRSMRAVASVSVVAPSCAVADALTKVVWLRGINDPMCVDLLARYSARVVMFNAAGLIVSQC